MKKVLAISTLVCGSLLFSACGGGHPGPDWYYSVPADKGVLYGVGASEAVFSEELARKSAEANATAEVSRQINQRISNMVDNFLRQAALGTEAERNATTQSVTRSLSSNDLTGLRIEKCEPAHLKEGEGYKFYCLARYDINSDLADKLSQRLSNSNGNGKVSDQALLDAYRSKQGFEEMKKELEKLKQEVPR